MNSVLNRTRPTNRAPQMMGQGSATPAFPRAWRHAPSVAVGDRAGRWGMAVVLLLFGYEWLLSGLDKVLSSSFRGGLGAALQQGMKDNPNHWYTHFLNAAVLPHTGVAAALVVGGEFLVAAGLVAGAGLWLSGARLPLTWARALHFGLIGALLGSALMTANYYLLAGNTWPWLNTGNPFNEGLSIDGLLTLVALALVAVQLLAMRARPVAGGESAA